MSSESLCDRIRVLEDRVITLESGNLRLEIEIDQRNALIDALRDQEKRYEQQLLAVSNRADLTVKAAHRALESALWEVHEQTKMKNIIYEIRKENADLHRQVMELTANQGTQHLQTNT